MHFIVRVLPVLNFRLPLPILTSSFLSWTAAAHGVLGQTFQLARAESLKAFAANSTAGSTKAYTDSDIVEGTEDDYEVSGLFEHDFKFNRFVAPGGALVMAGRKLLASTAVRTQVPFTINMSGSSLRIRF